ncbi:MAG: diaminopimelate epimerase [Acidimicrobiia bacterium]
MDFVKMEGLGNDFVVFEGPLSPTAEEIADWCDRRRGVGADGVLVVSPVDGSSIAMEYWNADGSAAEMCGNGLRCVARYAVERGLVGSTAFTVMTPSGPRRVEVGAESVRAELGPVYGGGEVVQLAGYDLTSVSVGNPHAVAFVPDCHAVPVEAVGPAVEGDPAYPERTNVEFATVLAPDRMALRVWERGVGETLACGSGAAAAVAEACRTGRTGARVMVQLPGGELLVEIIDATAWIEGPARRVFEGSL